MTRRALRSVLLAPLACFPLFACSSSPGDGSEAPATSAESAITTSDVISRAKEWVDARLHYCQSSYEAPDPDSSCWGWEGPAHRCDRESNAAWNPYRSDCSGFVTWSWGLPPVGDGGYVTGDFAPFDGSFSHVIAGTDLQPGDALNKATNEHIVLFERWITPGQSALFMEEPGCSVSDPYAHEFSSAVSIWGSQVVIDYEGSTPFVAIRFDGAQKAPAAAASFEVASAAKTNKDGRLEVVALGEDDAVRADAQTSAGQQFAGWAGLGGALAASPVLARNADGRLEVFGPASDGSVWHVWQATPGGSWSTWASTGGNAAGAVAVARNADGRLEAFVRGKDHAIHHDWQTAANGGWHGWATMGGNYAGDPVVAVNADGRVEIFAEGDAGALWHAWQTTPGGAWSDWADMGGTPGGTPAVARNSDGRLEVFVRGTDSALWHAWQKTAGGTWSQWASMGGSYAGSIAAATNADGRVEVFAVGNRGGLWHVWQTTQGGGWSDAANLGGDFTGAVSVARNADGRLEVFGRGTDAALWHDWQTTAGGSWSGLASLGGTLHL